MQTPGGWLVCDGPEETLHRMGVLIMCVQGIVWEPAVRVGAVCALPCRPRVRVSKSDLGWRSCCSVRLVVGQGDPFSSVVLLACHPFGRAWLGDMHLFHGDRCCEGRLLWALLGDAHQLRWIGRFGQGCRSRRWRTLTRFPGQSVDRLKPDRTGVAAKAATSSTDQNKTGVVARAIWRKGLYRSEKAFLTYICNWFAC